MNEGAKQANEDMWRRQMLAELTAIKNALQKEEPKTDSLQRLKAEICSTCGYFPCVNRKQFEGTIITHCTQYYKLSAV